jgi:hypothetical protein
VQNIIILPVYLIYLLHSVSQPTENRVFSLGCLRKDYKKKEVSFLFVRFDKYYWRYVGWICKNWDSEECLQTSAGNFEE